MNPTPPLLQSDPGRPQLLPSEPNDEASLAEQLCQVGRMFYARGWSLGTSSNYSVVLSREPLQLMITASGKDKGALQQDDFVVVDRQGRPVRAGQPKSSAETLLHCLLAEDCRAGAVLHTHSVWATLLSQLNSERGELVIEDYEMLKGLEGITSHRQRTTVPVFDNSQDMPALAQQVRERLHSIRAGDGGSPVHGFLLRQHGLYTWGVDLFAARRHVEIFEFLFECLTRKLTLQAQLPTLFSKEV
jgi:methylthioribulose-1-phosphate dehydratase